VNNTNKARQPNGFVASLLVRQNKWLIAYLKHPTGERFREVDCPQKKEGVKPELFWK
jgi:hypothetical protein